VTGDFNLNFVFAPRFNKGNRKLNVAICTVKIKAQRIIIEMIMKPPSVGVNSGGEKLHNG
jgi:hypothetical protein